MYIGLKKHSNAEKVTGSIKVGSIETESKNQDGGVGRHTAPPHTTRTDRKSNGKEVRHQVDKK